MKNCQNYNEGGVQHQNQGQIGFSMLSYPYADYLLVYISKFLLFNFLRTLLLPLVNPWKLWG